VPLCPRAWRRDLRWSLHHFSWSLCGLGLSCLASSVRIGPLVPASSYLGSSLSYFCAAPDPALMYASPSLGYASVILNVVCFSLIISSAASPWLGFTAPNVPAQTFGLLTWCSGGNCVSMAQAPYSNDLCELKVTAAFLFISFICSFFAFATLLALMAESDALIADPKLRMAFSALSWFTALLGCIIGCNNVRCGGCAALLLPCRGFFYFSRLPAQTSPPCLFSLPLPNEDVCILLETKHPVRCHGHCTKVHAHAWV
jgi:hypothetical protein